MDWGKEGESEREREERKFAPFFQNFATFDLKAKFRKPIYSHGFPIINGFFRLGKFSTLTGKKLMHKL